MDQTDPPFYTFLSRTNSEMSDVSSVQSTSSQASDDSDRVPTQEDNDNWRYLSDFFVMTKTPTNTSTRLCGYKGMLCLPSDRIVKASKTTYDALKSHFKTHHSVKEGEFKALIGQRPSHNSGEEILLE